MYVSLMSRDTPSLYCPECTEPFVDLSCPACGFTAIRRYTFPSVLDVDIERDSVAHRLAEAAAKRPLREAVAEFEGTVERSLRSELFDPRGEEWRFLLEKSLDGPCLDVNAGYGTRAMLLAEIFDHVRAIEPDLAKARVISTRDDFDEGDRVSTIHADELTLPLAPGQFPTVIADFAGRHVSSLPSRITSVAEMVAPNGVFVIKIDGWPRRAGLTSIGGVDGGTFEPSFRGLGDTPRRYRRLLRTLGFESVDVFTLFPTASLVELIYHTASEPGVDRAQTLLESRTQGIANRLLPSLFTLSRHSGALKRSYPSYLLVGSNRPGKACSRVLTTGRTRATILKYSHGAIESVRKIPNRRGHSVFTEREQRILTALSDRNHRIVDTLPNGTPEDTRFGTIRHEAPVTGTALSDTINRTPATIARVLQIGLQWLATFQLTFQSGRETIDPGGLKARLGPPPEGVEMPTHESIDSIVVPVHGDFTPGNVYVEDGSVSAVIDWEYGAIEGLPFVDPTFFVLDTVSSITGDIPSAATAIRTGRSTASLVARDAIQEYCRAVGLSPDAFERLLAVPYLRRLRMDADSGAATNDTPTAARRASVARELLPEDQ